MSTSTLGGSGRALTALVAARPSLRRMRMSISTPSGASARTRPTASSPHDRDVPGREQAGERLHPMPLADPPSTSPQRPSTASIHSGSRSAPARAARPAPRTCRPPPGRPRAEVPAVAQNADHLAQVLQGLLRRGADGAHRVAATSGADTSSAPACSDSNDNRWPSTSCISCALRERSSWRVTSAHSRASRSSRSRSSALVPRRSPPRSPGRTAQSGGAFGRRPGSRRRRTRRSCSPG